MTVPLYTPTGGFVRNSTPTPLNPQKWAGVAYPLTWGLSPQAKPKGTKALGDGNRGLFLMGALRTPRRRRK